MFALIVRCDSCGATESFSEPDPGYMVYGAKLLGQRLDVMQWNINRQTNRVLCPVCFKIFYPPSSNRQ